MRRWLGGIVIAIGVLGGACSAGAAGSSPPAGRQAEAGTALPSVTFTTAGGESVPLAVEVADAPAEQQCGLMHREAMPEEQGMLFAFAYDSTGGFWNRNTLIPLSVIYIAGDGRIVDVLEMEATPYAGAPGVVQPPVREPYRYVIEVNQGWHVRHGIAVGDRVAVGDAVALADFAAPPPICEERGT